MHEAPVRIVQVGLGGWGGDWATACLPTIPAVDVVGHVDLDPATFEAVIASGVGTPESCFTSLAEAMAATDPTAVLVTTDVSAHFPVAREALLAGRHVLVEKPFAVTMEQAEALVELAEQTGRTLMVSQNYRYFPAVRAAQRWVRSGELGRLLAIDVDFRQPAGDDADTPPEPDPRRDREPLLRDMSIHHFDLMRAIVGREAVSVDCRSWQPEQRPFSGPMTAAALVDFDGGPVVSYRGTFASAAEKTAWSGQWRMEFDRGEVRWSCRGEPDRMRIWPVHAAAREVELPSGPDCDRLGSVAEFVAALRERRPPETSGRDNVHTFAICCGAIESARQRAPVALPAAVPAVGENEV